MIDTLVLRDSEHRTQMEFELDALNWIQVSCPCCGKQLRLSVQAAEVPDGENS